MKMLAHKLVIPLTVISFATFTKWWFVLLVDGPERMMIGYPLPYACEGSHTSGSLYIFLFELGVDLSFYFLFWLLIIYIIQKFIAKIRIHKIVLISLYLVAGVMATGMLLIGTISDNSAYLKRDFDIVVLTSGYRFFWEDGKRPDLKDFDWKTIRNENFHK